MSIIERKILFRDAAEAAGLTASTLRNWLDRGQVTLAADEGRKRGWRRFTRLDVFRLAMVGQLVSFGFDVRAANAALVAHIDPLVDNAAVVAQYAPLPSDADLSFQFNGWMLIVVPDGRVALLQGALPHEKLYMVRAGKEPQEMPNPGWRARWGSEWFLEETPAAFLLIRLEAVARDVGAVLDRLAMDRNDGDD